MPIARRDLLGLGAAVAVSLATTSCRDAQQDARQAPIPPPSLTPETSAAPPSPSFPGQPPPGTLYYGASVPHHRSLPSWEAKLGSTLTLNRSYFTPDRNETAQLIHRCDVDLAHGRMPHVSIKPPGTWQEIATGGRDDWLASMLRHLGDRSAPIFFTLHHEPEKQAGRPGMQPAAYVAMQRRAIAMATELAPQVTIVPVLQQWTFDPLRHDSDPSQWIVPEASAVGLDVFNPWSPTNGKLWRTFSSKVDEAIGWFGDTPIVIGEYGCRDDPDIPGLAADWLRNAADYARGHSVVAMSYFNSGVNSPDGPWTLRGQTEQVFAELLASDWVARPV